MKRRPAAERNTSSCFLGGHSLSRDQLVVLTHGPASLAAPSSSPDEALKSRYLLLSLCTW
ncbi:hypothetical protein E2C01_061559 [Portunus trituberculatus]|uniref:Uncharacterized protein n=1 Tax=Portunus trituberculatus TaxID=210409 RepID=A0A5B7HFD9_PORTR|nr:hypothetical protein [Portunus trituberculatus]